VRSRQCQATDWQIAYRSGRDAFRRSEEAVSPAARSVRGLHGIHRSRTRSCDPAGSKDMGPARQQMPATSMVTTAPSPEGTVRYAQSVHLVQRILDFPSRRQLRSTTPGARKGAYPHMAVALGNGRSTRRSNTPQQICVALRRKPGKVWRSRWPEPYQGRRAAMRTQFNHIIEWDNDERSTSYSRRQKNGR